MDRKTCLAGVRRIVIKLGTRMITSGPYTLDTEALARLAMDIADLHRHNYEIIIVTSAAIAAGMGRMGIHRRPRAIPQLQALASIGQNLLLNAYEKALGMFGLPIGQVLLTIDDIHNRKRYTNLRNAFNELLRMGVIPIVNENDAVGTEEVKVGDNDNLSSYVASLVNADLLVLFTDVDGLYDRDPREGDGNLISLVTRITPEIEALSGGAGDPAAVGGMRTKIEAANRVLSAGGMMIIVNGKKARLQEILQGDDIGTLFCPERNGLAARSHWIAMSARVCGILKVDAGAAQAIVEKNASLLPKGITGVEGNFVIGDVVTVADPAGEEIARGVTLYDSYEIRKIMGNHSEEITAILGYNRGTTVIHRNDMVNARVKK
ncbi:MAG: glutamate 5-kinase [Candidatus Latescibacter sp.]|nr:glutamate 5-kinase [Candidatus Latescibacter sp.]